MAGAAGNDGAPRHSSPMLERLRRKREAALVLSLQEARYGKDVDSVQREFNIDDDSLEEFHEIFVHLDVNNHGFVSFEELNYGLGFSEARSKEVFEAVGCVDRLDLAAFVRAILNPVVDLGSYFEALEAFDKDREDDEAAEDGEGGLDEGGLNAGVVIPRLNTHEAQAQAQVEQAEEDEAEAHEAARQAEKLSAIALAQQEARDLAAAEAQARALLQGQDAAGSANEASGAGSAAGGASDAGGGVDEEGQHLDRHSTGQSVSVTRQQRNSRMKMVRKPRKGVAAARPVADSEQPQQGPAQDSPPQEPSKGEGQGEEDGPDADANKQQEAEESDPRAGEGASGAEGGNDNNQSDQQGEASGKSGERDEEGEGEEGEEGEERSGQDGSREEEEEEYDEEGYEEDDEEEEPEVREGWQLSEEVHAPIPLLVRPANLPRLDLKK